MRVAPVPRRFQVGCVPGVAGALQDPPALVFQGSRKSVLGVRLGDPQDLGQQEQREDKKTPRSLPLKF